MAAPVTPVDKYGQPFEAGNPLLVSTGSEAAVTAMAESMGALGTLSDAPWIDGTPNATVIALLKAMVLNTDMIPFSGVDVDVNGSGDFTLVPAVSGKVIKVFRALLTVSDGAPIITFKSGTTKVPGTFRMKDGGAISLGLERLRWFECVAGQPFVMNLSASAKVSGLLAVWIG